MRASAFVGDERLTAAINFPRRKAISPNLIARNAINVLLFVFSQ